MQKLKAVKVTRKVKIVKRKFCIKKTHTFTIIAMNCVQEQLKTFVSKSESRVAKGFSTRRLFELTKNTAIKIFVYKSETDVTLFRNVHPI